jgi:hypothetical protein
MPALPNVGAATVELLAQANAEDFRKAAQEGLKAAQKEANKQGIDIPVAKGAGSSKALREVREQLKQTRVEVGRYSTSIGQLGDTLGLSTGAAVGMGAAIVATGVALKTIASSVSAWQEMTKAANQTQRAIGGTVEDASRLNNLFDDFGISSEKASASLAIFSRNLDSKAMKDLNLQSKTTIGLLTELSKKYKEAGSAAERANITTAAFGRGGAEFSKILALGPDGIAAGLKGNEGLIITDEDQRAVEQLRAVSDEIGDIWMEIKLSIARGVVPELLAALDVAKDIANTLKPLGGIGGTIKGALNIASGGALTGLNQFDQLSGNKAEREALAANKKAYSDLTESREAAAEATAAYVKEIEAETAAMYASIDAALARAKADKAVVDAQKEVIAAQNAQKRAPRIDALQKEISLEEERLRIKSENDQRASADEAITEAYKARSEAIAGVTEAEKEGAAAVQAAKDAVVDARQAVEDATWRVVSAEKAYQDAVKQTATLQRNVDRALVYATRAKEDLAFKQYQDAKRRSDAQAKALEDQAKAAKEAIAVYYMLQDAKIAAYAGTLSIAEAEAQARATDGQGGVEQQRAQLNLLRARMEAARQETVAARAIAEKQNTQEKTKSAVELAREETLARRELEDANTAVEDSELGVLNARERLAEQADVIAEKDRGRQKAVRDLNDARKDEVAAIAGVAKAETDASKLVADAKEKVRVAQKNLNDAYKNRNDLEAQFVLDSKKRELAKLKDAEAVDAQTAALERYNKAIDNLKASLLGQRKAQAADVAGIASSLGVTLTDSALIADAQKKIAAGTAANVAVLEAAKAQREIDIQAERNAKGIQGPAYLPGDQQLQTINQKLQKALADNPVKLSVDGGGLLTSLNEELNKLTGKVAVPIGFQVVDTAGTPVTQAQVQQAISALFSVTQGAAKLVSPTPTPSPSAGARVPQRANGGPLRQGQLALVGERGPELFVPGAAGSVVTNERLTTALERLASSGGTGRVQYVTINSAARERETSIADWARALG